MSIYSFPLVPNLRHIELSETGSTNTYARQHAAELTDRLCLITAEHQTAGRGATGGWQSLPGENLLFSLVYHPDELPATQVFRLSVAACVAICKALNEVHPGFEIKWPNDIYHGDSKCVGILIENELQGKCVGTSVIGAGVNINQTSFLPDAPNPTSLALLTGCEVNRNSVLQSIVRHFSLLAPMVQGEAWKDVFADYRQLLYRRTGIHTFRDSEGNFEAEMAEVEPDGHLVLLDTQGKKRRYAFKEVQFVITNKQPNN